MNAARPRIAARSLSPQKSGERLRTARSLAPLCAGRGAG
jgi:hypothetical protein